jgi:hypothetical protein
MFKKSFWIFVALFLCFFGDVLSQPNLCKNPKIDSIVWEGKDKMWFFTSGGYYYYIKSDQKTPPTKDQANPLPHGFKVGEAAYLRDEEIACGRTKTDAMKGEKEILLIENMGGANKIIIFDTKTLKWKDDVLDLSNDRSLGSINLEKGQTIDAIFSFSRAEVYAVQGFYYAGIDYTKVCKNKDDYAISFGRQNKSDLDTVSNIVAMTMTTATNLMMIDSEDNYWNIDLKGVTDTPGKLKGSKNPNYKSIAKDFFRCTGTEDTNETPDDSKTTPTAGGNKKTTEESTNKEKGSGVWIILLIVVVVIIAIALITVFVMCKKKSSADLRPEVSKGADSDAGVSTGAVEKSSSDAKVGSKVNSQGSQSKVSSKTAVPPSLRGMSTSKMPMRSITSTAPKGMESKSGSKNDIKSPTSKK